MWLTKKAYRYQTKNLDLIKIMEVKYFLTKIECDNILYEIEKKSNLLRVTNDFGSYDHAAKELHINFLDKSLIKDTILKKSNELSDKINCDVDNINFVKYESNGINHMPLHYDWCKKTLIVNLNDNYTGGGTGFPIHDNYFNVNEYGVGAGIMFNSMNFLSYHCAMKVNNGDRYAMVINFKSKNKSILRYFWKVPYLIVRDILFGRYIFNWYYHKVKKFKY